jgi:SAM-dependent methyltransferase
MDAVTCHLALMLMDDPTHVLSEMHRVLRPRGTLHLVVVNPIGFDPAIVRIIRALGTAGDHDVGTRAPQLGDQRTFTGEGLYKLLANGFESIEIEEVVVAREVLRTELWQFLSQSVYGLDHLSADAARDQFEQLALPPQISWRVPLYFAAAQSSGEY